MSGFVVKVTGNRGNVGWLSRLDPTIVSGKIIGLSSPQWRRSFVSRESAEVFATREAAQEAIPPMLEDEFNAGIVFSVEVVEATTG